jgi:LacI family transcriptional regulator
MIEAYMSSRITIRDVAEKAGVSVSSVHFALSGKKGVSEETRKKIRRVADELGYHLNTSASLLKRRIQNITVCVPSEDDNTRFYFRPIWKGIRSFEAKNPEGASFHNIMFNPEDPSDARRELKQRIEDGKVNGLLTVGTLEFPRADWEEIIRREISVVFVTVAPQNFPVFPCCIESDYRIIGRTMAELIVSRIEPYGSIFLSAGNPAWFSHAGIVKGFDEYMFENQIPNIVYKDCSYTTDEQNYEHFKRAISRPDVAACASVFSQGTIMLGKALEETNKAGRIFAVGSDLSPESEDMLRRKTYDAILEKNPYAQGYVGLQTLYENLVSPQPAETRDGRILIGSEIVLRSNLPLFEHDRTRVLLV